MTTPSIAVTAIEEAKTLFVKGRCDFMLAAAAQAQFPNDPLPEVALIGRSNVGKSSLINALVGNRKVARTSNTPGRTQQIVFFNMSDRMRLVDLPGYGHAIAPKAEREKWERFVKSYLAKRPQLRLILLLIDGRHGLVGQDPEMLHFLDQCGVSFQVVLTKGDKRGSVPLPQLLETLTQTLENHPAALSEIVVTSSEKGQGIDTLRTTIMHHAFGVNQG